MSAYLHMTGPTLQTDPVSENLRFSVLRRSIRMFRLSDTQQYAASATDIEPVQNLSRFLNNVEGLLVRRM